MTLSPYIQVSYDRGNTWTFPAMNGYFAGDNSVHDITFDWFERRWFAAGEGVVCMSLDSGNNWSQYSNPAYDGMLKAAQNDIDIQSRGQKLAAAEAILLKDQGVMPLFFWVSGNLVRPYVKGWSANALDKHRSRWISIDEKARSALFV